MHGLRHRMESGRGTRKNFSPTKKDFVKSSIVLQKSGGGHGLPAPLCRRPCGAPHLKDFRKYHKSSFKSFPLGHKLFLDLPLPRAIDVGDKGAGGRCSPQSDKIIEFQKHPGNLISMEQQDSGKTHTKPKHLASTVPTLPSFTTCFFFYHQGCMHVLRETMTNQQQRPMVFGKGESNDFFNIWRSIIHQ